MDITQLKLQK